MSVTRNNLITAAAAVRRVGVKRDDILVVTVGDKRIDPDAAAAALAEVEAVKPVADEVEAKPNVFARAMAWTEKKMPVVATLVEKTTDLALARPEDVDRHTVVEILTRDHTLITIPVVVRDEMTTKILRATSAGVGSVGLFPFFGNFVQAGTGIVAAVASGGSYLAGDKELGKALIGMAKKHTAMGLIGFIPVVGEVTGVQAIVDGKRLTESDVRVGEIAP